MPGKVRLPHVSAAQPRHEESAGRGLGVLGASDPGCRPRGSRAQPLPGPSHTLTSYESDRTTSGKGRCCAPLRPQPWQAVAGSKSSPARWQPEARPGDRWRAARERQIGAGAPTVATGCPTPGVRTPSPAAEPRTAPSPTTEHGAPPVHRPHKLPCKHTRPPSLRLSGRREARGAGAGALEEALRSVGAFGKAPSPASSALHGEGPPASHPTLGSQLPATPQPWPAGTLRPAPLPRGPTLRCSQMRSQQETKAANCPLCRVHPRTHTPRVQTCHAHTHHHIWSRSRDPRGDGKVQTRARTHSQDRKSVV